MLEHLFDLFGKLPTWARLVVFLLILVGVVAYDALEVFEHVPFWPAVRIVGGLIFAVLLLEVARWAVNLKLMKDLEHVKKDRDDRKQREDALNQVQKSLVWMRLPEEAPILTPTSDRQTKFIAFCNFKGGVGKTTLTLNVGVALAMKGKRVLLVDLDWQGTLSRLAVPKNVLKQYWNDGRTTEALFRDNVTVQEAKRLMISLDETVPTCSVIISARTLEVIEFEQQSRFFVDKKHEVRYLLQRIFHDPEIANAFDYVFFDSGPRLTMACVNGLVCADFVVVPTSLSEPDIHAVPDTLSTLKELHMIVRGVPLGAVVTGRMRSGKLISYEKAQLGALKKLISQQDTRKDFVFSAMIPDSPTIHKYSVNQKSAAFYDVDMREHFEKVGRELERRIPK